MAGDGINCEYETAHAFDMAGAQSTIVHINDLLENPTVLRNYQGMALPGGFSFGDELGSGQVLALKIKYKLKDEFKNFIEQKKAVIGICNGFQVLIKLGLLPDPCKPRSMALTVNLSGNFINKWSKLHIPKESICKWLHDLQGTSINLPIRHGEGRVVCKEDVDPKQVAFYYDEDVNGSYQQIAGVCDPTGMVLGMMPHPEAYLTKLLSGQKQDDLFAAGDGLKLFTNITNYLKQN
ncbi:MAG: phosphoribosylformylglycinamidine synthase subunit PurQ [Bacteriovoracaceae bacterium]|nr:phosphoribosylformylglycinamidine synthase subunit PurQ [Bacteriovoracaceae bacterium]